MDDTGPKERLIKTAIELFYKQGYDATSVNHIIEASSTHKLLTNFLKDSEVESKLNTVIKQYSKILGIEDQIIFHLFLYWIKLLRIFLKYSFFVSNC